MSLKAEVEHTITAQRSEFVEISHQLADHPELGMEEVGAANLLATSLEQQQGVSVQRALAGVPTALRATAGSGDLVITLCAEYDALPGIGHGCGHNLIAATAYGAFTALAPLADRLGITVQLVGTPGEENAGGKIMLLERGAFAGTHAALMLHPGPRNYGSMTPLASTDISVSFTGAPAHASYAPHLGRNALDALTVMMTAVGLARQQLEPWQQIHGVPVSPFGTANVIPAAAESSWMVRAATLESMHRAVSTLERCARAGAIAANCEFEFSVNPVAYAELEADADLLEFYQRSATTAGVAGPLFEPRGGSTDMGNLSLHVPAIHPMLQLGDGSAGIHTREFAQAARGSAGDDFVVAGATLLSHVVIDAAQHPDVRARLLRQDRNTQPWS
ncbi:M20 family metallopeptidase [Leucobacter sp. HY1908]